jgi:hypothetical protein
MEVNMHRNKTKNFWEDHAGKFIKLDITQAQYCRKNNLSQNYFSRVLSKTKAYSKNENTFIEITKPDKMPTGRITLNVKDKYSIVVQDVIDSASLNLLLDILEKRT